MPRASGLPEVQLSDNVTIGKAAADAIRYVLDESTADSFTWTLAVPAAGSYQLYARWVPRPTTRPAQQILRCRRYRAIGRPASDRAR
jgi:hypothetical protein